MSKNRNRNKGLYYTSQQKEPIVARQLIRDVKDKDQFGILLFRQDTLDEVYEASLPLARNNEFQFHYTSLVGTTNDGENNQTFRLSIPLICYNYKQTVSSAHIDFNLQEVEDIANQLMPIAQDKASEFLNSEQKEKVETIFGEMDWTIVPYQSMHRHPGGSHQGFSGTDYGKDVSNPGVVFPFTNPVEPTLSFASIMYISGDRCKIAHTEMRIAEKDDKDILYSHGRSITAVRGIKAIPTLLESMFGIEGEGVENYIIKDGTGAGATIQNRLMEIVDIKPDVFVDGALLSSQGNYRNPIKGSYQQGIYNRQAYGGLFQKDTKKDLVIVDEDFDFDGIPMHNHFPEIEEEVAKLSMPEEKQTEFETEKEIRAYYSSEDFDCLDIAIEGEYYIHDPQYMEEMDKDILLDAVLEEIDNTTGYVRSVLEKVDEDRIFEIAREFSILGDPIEFNEEELKV